MNWFFELDRPVFKVYPATERSISGRAVNWRSMDAWRGPLDSVVSKASGAFGIYSVETAKGILSNMLEKGEALLQAITDESDFAWVTYWHDPAKSNESVCNFCLGMREDNFRKLHESFQFAVQSMLKVELRGSGGFSVSEGNPYSTQPTMSGFEAGYPVLIHDFSVHLASRY
ncbi:hypothetical protein [Novosphingobium sp.]|uniref:hypothetical protein n=1 Tax=Novosphingobium sp. TaxID=1874826 RepID=UPI0025ED42C6|nr:hypothetical protein [Novosphingobium sp.]